MMLALRVIIADDEPLALDRLSDLLAQLEEVEVVAALHDPRQVLAATKELRPDLLLLDIEMPKIDGFDIVEALLRDWPAEQKAEVPLVAFVTAYPQFASAAFDTGALDFLCKPVRLGRLEKTIERARLALMRSEALARLDTLSGLLDELREAREPTDEHFVWIQQRGGIVRVDVSSLDWLQAEGEYVRAHAGEQSYLLRSSISAFCADLQPAGFVRVHRSAAINLKRVSRVSRSRNGFRVALESGIELAVGRKYRPKIQALFPS